MHHQGQEPKHVHIVVDGDFTIIRMKKNHYKLMDPTKADMVTAARNLSKERALTFLGPRATRAKPEPRGNEKVEHGDVPNALNHNNTLRQGKQNPAGNLCIMIASQGQILGLEDILNKRNYTASVKCTTKSGTALRLKIDDFFKIIHKDNKSFDYLEAIKGLRDDATIGKLVHAHKVFKKFSEPVSLAQANSDGTQPASTNLLKAGNKAYRSLIEKYNMRQSQERLDDFRATIKEIVDVNQYGMSPRDKRDLDG